jgi:hypothetical protein
MRQNQLNLTNLKDLSVSPDLSSHCLSQLGYLGFRFVRYKYSPWLTLASTPFKLLYASGLQRTDVQVRYLRALSKINFVGLYGVLNDWLW